MKIVLQLLLLAIGFLLLIKGADWFVDGAVCMAEKLKIPQLIIGLTIIAMGTSMPEAAVSISAAAKGNADITIGNIMGSNILNILIILGISAIVAPLAVKASTIRYELPFLLGITILVLIQGLDGTVTALDGGIQLLLFVTYLLYLLISAKKHPLKQENISKGLKSWPQILFFTIVGLVIIIAGSNLTVDAASTLARICGISERFIGLTIVALGTSLPELFTSVAASKKGSSDIAIGNIVGSNIFNLLFIVGTSAAVTSVPYAAAFRFDNLVAAVATILLLACCIKSRKLSRQHGIFMLIGYMVYLGFLLI